MEKGSSSSSSSPAVAASINPFKFGTKIHFGGGLHPQEEVEEAAPPRSPAKKGRMAVRCQVEGCSVDLSDSKAYYCRHKVCGVHSKSPMVIVAGLHQRFCQQCSRFHQLPEFDQGKRSCRRRLAGHNERRRKPPPSPLLSSRYTSLSPSIFDGNITIDAYSGGLLSGHATASTRSFQLPLPQAAAAPHSLLQGSTTRSSYSIAGDCLRESRSALSLLSNEPWGSTSQASDHGDGVDSSSAPFSRYSVPSWELRGDSESGPSLVEMPSGTGSAQTSHSHSTNSPYSRNHINWSL